MDSAILFLCPHGAAKSILAAAYFNRLAKQGGLPLTGTAAGTEPSEIVALAVVELLRGEGIDVSQQRPARVTDEQLARAQRVISLGCDVSNLEVARDKVEEWLDVPPVSENLAGASDAIRQRVERLIDEIKSEGV
jgi:arsenate reductase (thioredoxin)